MAADMSEAMSISITRVNPHENTVMHAFEWEGPKVYCGQKIRRFFLVAVVTAMECAVADVGLFTLGKRARSF